jgi:hypothetical protein
MKTLFAPEGQTHCFDCGEQFVPDHIPTSDSPFTATTCPNGCRGSWAKLGSNKEYTTELTKLRVLA